MTVYIALLRAVNVGGSGKLPMTELKTMCIGAGFSDPRTYIASGNVVFGSRKSASAVKAYLEQALEAYARKSIGVLLRTGQEMAAVLAANPFPGAAPNRTVAIFLDRPPSADVLASVSGIADEQLAVGRREIYVHYGAGMAQSKLKIPAARNGTARNMNTIATLAAWAAARAPAA